MDHRTMADDELLQHYRVARFVVSRPTSRTNLARERGRLRRLAAELRRRGHDIR